jgi:ribosomal protein S18 acetylase RimI-like enzyme
VRVTELMDGLPAEVVDHLTTAWGSTVVSSRGQLHDLRGLPALAVRGHGRLLGLAFYSIHDGQCELVALDTTDPGHGVGTALLEAVVERARVEGCSRVWLATTNDNTVAMRFYQRHGMRLVAVYPGAVDAARAVLKPEIPLVGCDEIEFEIRLD